MPALLAVTGITGTSPFYISICDGYGEDCVDILIKNDSSVPFFINVPYPYNDTPAVVLKIIDSKGCIRKEETICTDIGIVTP